MFPPTFCGFIVKCPKAGGLCSLLALSAVSTLAQAEEAPPDRNQFNLFHPTPAEKMREMHTDRPDKTESPYTLDPGHLQLEMDFANFTRDATDGFSTRAWNIAPVNLKIGLLSNLDVQLVYDNYLNVRTVDRSTGTVTTQSGFGDFTARLKLNLWGNDGGSTAFALLPFVKFPASTAGLGNNSVEGGMLLPLAVELPGGWGMGLETGAAFARDAGGGGRHAEFVNSVTLGHDIIGKLGGYMEFFSLLSSEGHADWIGTVDVGLTYAFTGNVQFDCGCNLGATKAADDVNVFAGISIRH